VLRGHEGDVTALTSHDELLVSGGLDKCLRIWNTATGQCIHALEGHDTGIGILEWNADYTLIVTGASGGAVKIWRVSDG
jgi:WD40 repeat protein